MLIHAAKRRAANMTSNDTTIRDFIAYIPNPSTVKDKMSPMTITITTIHAPIAALWLAVIYHSITKEGTIKVIVRLISSDHWIAWHIVPVYAPMLLCRIATSDGSTSNTPVDLALITDAFPIMAVGHTSPSIRRKRPTKNIIITRTINTASQATKSTNVVSGSMSSSPNMRWVVVICNAFSGSPTTPHPHQ
jgi:hypothetical protein